MSALPSRPRLALAATLLAIAVPLLAQHGAIAFKHFHQYPSAGQWSTEGFTTVAGKPFGAPASSTACASPLSAARRDAITKMSNDAAPNCEINMLRDEENTAEYEQVCTYPRQTIHSTMHAVDNETMTMDIRYPGPGGSEVVTHTTSHYLGACTAAQKAEADQANATPLPSMKLSPEDCAGVADMRKQAEQSVKSCDSPDFPETQRASCRSSMAGLLRQVKVAEQGCAK